MQRNSSITGFSGKTSTMLPSLSARYNAPSRVRRLPERRSTMVGRSSGAVLLGIDARLIHVEVDLPGGLPIIAAGDNLSFFPLGPVLRRAGGFFIRRAFRGDKLYAGNSQRVFENTSPFDEVTGELGDELRELFRGYEAELESNAGQSVEDPDVREGLSALGYTE